MFPGIDTVRRFIRIAERRGVPFDSTVLVLNGPRYKWTSDLLSGVVKNALVTNLGHPCGWLTVQHLQMTRMSLSRDEAGRDTRAAIEFAVGYVGATRQPIYCIYG